MTAQEIAGRLTQEQRQSTEAVFRRTLPKLTVALLSALMNRAPLPGGYCPFGAAFIAAVPSEYATIAAVGGVISCLTDGGLLTSLEGLRHVAALLAVGGIRWALGELSRVNSAKFYPFFTALAGILLTGSVINSTTGAMISYSTMFFLLEGVMAGMAAMFFAGASEALGLFDGGTRLGRSTAISLMMTLCAALLPLCRVEIFRLSPGLILLHTAVLLALPAKREVGGAVGGITVGCVTSLSQYSLSQGTIFPVAALLAGYAARYGRIFSASVYIAVCFTGNLISGSMDYTLVAETAIAGVISCLIPSEWAERALSAAGLLDERHSVCGASDSSEVVKRLGDAASALTGVSTVLEQVSDRLEKKSCPEEEKIYIRAVDKVCAECACRENCCGEGEQGTRERVRRLAVIHGSGRLRKGTDVSEALGKKCIRENQLMGEIRSLCGYHIASCSAHRRLSQVRSAVNDQLDGVGIMLKELSGEIGAAGREDVYSAERLAASLKACGYDVETVSCLNNRSGRLTVSLRLKATDRTVLGQDEIGAYVEESLGCEFDAPTFEGNGETLQVRLVQRQIYALRFGGAQHCCQGEQLCGDAYESFEDGEGGAYMLLSDGMGSGGRAAVDGALACGLFSQLMKGGFGYESAVKIVNAALMIKSEEESLSTIDSLRLNLYNGRAMFCKAGAAQSYHVRDGLVNRIDTQSLPLGILRETETAQYCFTAEEGDLIVMISDGVPTDDSLWFEKLLGQYGGEDVEHFAQFLLRRAVSRRPSGEDDDITVMVGKVEVNS